METLELQVKTLDEVTAAAAKQLGLSPDDITVKVLEESAGLFGKKKVKVQVEHGAASEKPAKPARGAKAKAEPAAEEPVAESKPAKSPSKAKAAPVAEEAPAEKPSRTRGKKAEAKPTAGEEQAPAAEADAESNEPEILATEADADAIVAIIEEVLEKADLEATVKLKELQGRYVNLELDGKDVAHLIGKSGEVLNAFQYLINLILNKRLDNGVRVTLDGNNYRNRREEVLRNLAMNVAKEVIKRQEEAVFDALPAFERRIVHKVLAEIEGVTTYSEGVEPNRHVVVAPAS